MALRTLVWGCGEGYKAYSNLIDYQRLKGSIEIVGITGRQEEYESINGIPFIPKESLRGDICQIVILCCMDKTTEISIRKEAKEKGFDEDGMIPVSKLGIPGMDIEKYFFVKNQKISIISATCWGGIAYHHLGLPFLSPFINVDISETMFLKMASDFRAYMANELQLQGWRSYPTTGKEYPYFRLGDIEIGFPHDGDENDIIEKWNRRKERINYEHLFFAMGTRKEENLYHFEQIEEVKHGVCFTSFPTELPMGCYLPTANHHEGKVEQQAITVIRGCMYGYDLLDILTK